jgi:tetratricopeptide (TPR) repeat protein
MSKSHRNNRIGMENSSMALDAQTLVHEQQQQIQSFWLAMGEAENRRTQAIYDAKLNLDKIEEQIEESRKKMTISKVALEKIGDLKKRLGKQIGNISDPSQEAERYLKHYLKNSEFSDRTKDWFVALGIVFTISVAIEMKGWWSIFTILAAIPAVFFSMFLFFKIRSLQHKKKLQKSATMADFMLDRWLEFAHNDYNKECTEAENQYEKDIGNIKKRFLSLFDKQLMKNSEYKNRIGLEQLQWKDDAWENWTPNSDPISEIRLGSLQLDIVNTANKMAKGCLDQRCYNSALEMCNGLLSINSNNVKALFIKGASLYNLGNIREALEVFTSVSEIEPKLAAVWFNKAMCLKELGETSAALKAVNVALEIEPNNTLFQEERKRWRLKQTSSKAKIPMVDRKIINAVSR